MSKGKTYTVYTPRDVTTWQKEQDFLKSLPPGAIVVPAPLPSCAPRPPAELRCKV